MKNVWAICLACLLSSCSMIATAPRKFVIQNNWIRSTISKNYLGYRRMNRMSPLIYKNLLIQSNAIDGIVAFRKDTGSELWKFSVRNGIEAGAIVSGDKLYFGASDGNFYCLNPNTGKVVWSFATHVETLSLPTVENSIVYFETGAGVVFALDASSGKQLWLYNRGTTQSLTIRAGTQPVIDGDNLLVGFSDGFLVSLRKRDGILAWDKKLAHAGRFKDVDATPVIEGDIIYISSFDGALYALKRQNGEVIWQHDEGGYTSPLVTKENIFYSTTSGLIQSLDKTSGKVLWSTPVKKGIATQPNIYKGYLVYGESDAGLVVADARTGKTITRFEPGRGLVAQPSIDKETGDVFFVSNEANLYAMKLRFEKTTEKLPWQN